jgi:hypothetical protein
VATPITGGAQAPLSPLYVTVGLRKVFFQELADIPPEWPQVINLVTFDRRTGLAQHSDRKVAGLGSVPRKPQGEPFRLDSPVLGGAKTYVPDSFGLGFEITWEAWEDELYGIMRKLAIDLARVMRDREERIAWGPFNDMFDTNVTGFAPGESLVYPAHALLRGGTFGNRGDGGNPAVDFGPSVLGLMNALAVFDDMVTDANMPAHITPRYVVFSTKWQFVIDEILGSEHKPYTATNEVNVLRKKGLIPVKTHYATNKDRWAVVADKGKHDVAMHYRTRPIFRSFMDERTWNQVHVAAMRATAGFGEWRGWWGSTA